MRRHFIGGLIGLVLIAGGTTATVSLVERYTRDKIAANQSAREMRIVAAVLPNGSYNNKPHEDMRLIIDDRLLGSQEPLPAYRASLDKTPAAIAMTIEAPDGYVAPIRLLIGIDSEGRVIAVRAIQHLETPGLGDQIDAEKSAWIEQFKGRKLPAENVPLALRRDGGDLDHISGATITSRAVSNAVSNALRYYEQNRAQLFAQDAAAQTTAQQP